MWERLNWMELTLRFGCGILLSEFLKQGFSGHCRALDGIVGALDLGHVHEAGAAANQQAPGKG